MTSPIRGERRLPLDITTTRTDLTGDVPALTAYAFSSGGALLDAQPLDGKGNARLTLGVDKEGDAVRVVLGPEIPKDEITVAEVLRRGGIDAHVAVRASTERLAPVQFDLTSDRVKHWLGRFCIVKGTLTKRYISGGIPVSLPVCNATVDIWEVDSWPRILPQLPDFELDRLRDILDGPWPPIRWPIPPRPPEDVFPEFNPRFSGDPIGGVSLNPQPLPPRIARRSTSLVARAARAVPAATDAPIALPSDLRIAVRAGRPALERAVIANIDLLRPILCWLYPRFVTKTKIASVTTDECGHFRKLIWRSIFDTDVPDLYFTARQRVFLGFWITIYEPTPVACHTHWNYVCGTEVSLVTTHPLAHTCAPCRPIVAPNNWVLFMALGNTSVARIHGANDATRIGSAGFSSAAHGLLDDSRPWGATLRPRVEFDNSLRALGVHYYRISFKRPTQTDAEWTFSDAPVTRHYIHTVGTDVVITPYSLGPKTPIGGTPHLYEIPPALPPEGQWSMPDVVVDTQSGEFPTRLPTLAPGAGYLEDGTPTGTDRSGLFQIRVELFTAAGVLVDPEALGINWRVPTTPDITGTIYTANAADFGMVDAARNCMLLTVHVNNNPCFASIEAPTVGGSPASDNCGVMRYSDGAQTVTTPFTAVHRNGFANYHFYVRRGEGSTNFNERTGTAPTTPAGMPAAPSSSVSTLLGECTLAGFLEYVGVDFTGTDGWSDLNSGYDASDLRAFVLAPQAPTVVSPIATP
jgi:hypothetical protein